MELAGLKKASDEARAAYDEKMAAKLLANPEAAPLVKEMQEKQTELKAMYGKRTKKPRNKKGAPVEK